ncbi:hypothetical protein BDR05DRAFT_793356 [Suillus weaverae]|nr:hypothetical protein BDR05DRAFT_793356 [Suillus weaverae]
MPHRVLQSSPTELLLIGRQPSTGNLQCNGKLWWLRYVMFKRSRGSCSCSTIILSTSGEPQHVPLTSVTLTDLDNLKDRFARAIRPH